MSVAARFYVTNVDYPAHNPTEAKIRLQPVVRGPENAAWSKATPSGSIEMYVSNEDAVDWFRQAQLDRADVAITFDRAPETEDRQY